jgi:hypothetical protein
MKFIVTAGILHAAGNVHGGPLCYECRHAALEFDPTSPALATVRRLHSNLPLPRKPPHGYAVQMLDTDTLLDRASGNFLPVALPAAGLFDSFDDAHAAAPVAGSTATAEALEEHRLAIVPASFDPVLQRHVLIYGVLCGQP